MAQRRGGTGAWNWFDEERLLMSYSEKERERETTGVTEWRRPGQEPETTEKSHL